MVNKLLHVFIETSLASLITIGCSQTGACRIRICMIVLDAVNTDRYMYFKHPRRLLCGQRGWIERSTDGQLSASIPRPHDVRVCLSSLGTCAPIFYQMSTSYDAQTTVNCVCDLPFKALYVAGQSNGLIRFVKTRKCLSPTRVHPQKRLMATSPIKIWGRCVLRKTNLAFLAHSW